MSDSVIKPVSQLVFNEFEVYCATGTGSLALAQRSPTIQFHDHKKIII